LQIAEVKTEIEEVRSQIEEAKSHGREDHLGIGILRLRSSIGCADGIAALRMTSLFSIVSLWHRLIILLRPTY